MRRRGLVLGLVLALAIPLVWVLIRATEEPLSVAFWYVLWRANLALNSLPQDAFWVLFVCLAAAIAIASLLAGRKAQPAGQEGVASRGGVVRQLAYSINRADEAYYFRWLLAGQVSGLIVEAMDTGGKMAAGPRRQWWAMHSATVPPDIRKYVEAALWGGFWQAGGVTARLRRALSTDQSAPPLDLDLETVVRFLEDQVEGADDR